MARESCAVEAHDRKEIWRSQTFHLLAWLVSAPESCVPRAGWLPGHSSDFCVLGRGQRFTVHGADGLAARFGARIQWPQGRGAGLAGARSPARSASDDLPVQ